MWYNEDEAAYEDVEPSEAVFGFITSYDPWGDGKSEIGIFLSFDDPEYGGLYDNAYYETFTKLPDWFKEDTDCECTFAVPLRISRDQAQEDMEKLGYTHRKCLDYDWETG